MKKAGERLYESFIDELSNISSSVVPQQGEMGFLAEIITEIKNTKPSGRVSAEFNLEKLKNDPSLDILLQDGDKVTIPEFLDHIYIFGEINTEGTIRYKEELISITILIKREAIALMQIKRMYMYYTQMVKLL